MDEYISIGDVLDIVSQYCPDDDGSCSKPDVDPREMLDEIEALPVADVQAVRHGRWLEHHAIWIDQPEIKGWFVQAKCSECERWAHVMNPYTKSIDYECCPRCGARMDGDIE